MELKSLNKWESNRTFYSNNYLQVQNDKDRVMFKLNDNKTKKQKLGQTKHECGSIYYLSPHNFMKLSMKNVHQCN